MQIQTQTRENGEERATRGQIIATNAQMSSSLSAPPTPLAPPKEEEDYSYLEQLCPSPGQEVNIGLTGTPPHRPGSTTPLHKGISKGLRTSHPRETGLIRPLPTRKLKKTAVAKQHEREGSATIRQALQQRKRVPLKPKTSGNVRKVVTHPSKVKGLDMAVTKPKWQAGHKISSQVIFKHQVPPMHPVAGDDEPDFTSPDALIGYAYYDGKSLGRVKIRGHHSIPVNFISNAHLTRLRSENKPLIRALGATEDDRVSLEITVSTPRGTVSFKKRVELVVSDSYSEFDGADIYLGEPYFA